MSQVGVVLSGVPKTKELIQTSRPTLLKRTKAKDGMKDRFAFHINTQIHSFIVHPISRRETISKQYNHPLTIASVHSIYTLDPIDHQ